MSVNLNNFSIAELKKIKRNNQLKLKKEYSEYKKKQELIADINKLQKVREKIKLNPKIKINNKPKPKSKLTKTFEEYFQECIKNKTIPPDTPSYLRKALERALKEYDQGIEKEKSSLDEFANKYIVKGKTGITPFEFFKSKSTYLKDFLRNHRNIKVRLVLVCLMKKMEKITSDGKLGFTISGKAYFQSDTHINLESTDVKEILTEVIHTILEKISIYQKNGSGWYFKEIVHLEIHTVIFKPMRGSAYIPLPDWIHAKESDSKHSK